MINNQHDIYFERQGCLSLKCGLHALNNLFGGKIFTTNSLNEICYEMSDDWVNPHKHIFGGEYDVNVLMMALLQKGYDTQWLDKRKIFKFREISINKRVLGLLICRRQESTCMKKICKIEARHWICVRILDDSFILIDSKAERPVFYPSEEQFESTIQEELLAGTQVLLVFSKQ